MTPRRGFGSDNHAGVHPAILAAIVDAQGGHVASYGSDPWSERAHELFRQNFGPDAQTFFVFNGTAANVLALAALVQPGEAILCADVAHIQNDESAAPEFFTRAKVIPVRSAGGKLTVAALDEHFIRRGDIHFAQATVLSVTQPTEMGTLYTLNELAELVAWARAKKLRLHLDGARLPVAAASLGCGFAELTRGFDAISYGGTKNGFLAAEAIVVRDPATARRLAVLRKQSGQLPSKSRFIAAQFIASFTGDLWREIALGTIARARRLYEGCRELVNVTQAVEANALFVRLTPAMAKRLREKFFFYVWDEKNWECRWMISWDTTDQDIDDFLALIRENS